LAPFLLLAGLVFTSGCSNEPPLPPLVPCKGQVLVDGKLLTTGGNVTLIPEKTEAGKAAHHMMAGSIDSSGSFEIFTGGKPGAPVGKYKVTVSPPMVPAEGAKKMPTAPYNEKFKNPTQTTLTIEVAAGKETHELKLTK
jgi:hypothetical protein